MSPKNKGKMGNESSAALETDQFLTGVDRAVEALRPHAKALAVAGGIIVVGLVSWAVWDWYSARQATKATTAYAGALETMDAPIVAPESEAPEPAAAGLEPPPSFDSHDARAAAALAEIDALRGEYGGVGVAEMARFDEARLRFQQGDHAGAAELYRALAGSDAPGRLRLLARENLGYSLEAQAMASEDPAARQAGLNEALEAFRAMQPKQDGPRRAYALFHQARLLAELGQTDEAAELFQQVLVEHPNSPLTADVESRLAKLGVDAPEPPAETEAAEPADTEAAAPAAAE